MSSDWYFLVFGSKDLNEMALKGLKVYIYLLLKDSPLLSGPTYRGVRTRFCCARISAECSLLARGKEAGKGDNWKREKKGHEGDDIRDVLSDKINVAPQVIQRSFFRRAGGAFFFRQSSWTGMKCRVNGLKWCLVSYVYSDLFRLLHFALGLWTMPSLWCARVQDDAWRIPLVAQDYWKQRCGDKMAPLLSSGPSDYI